MKLKTKPLTEVEFKARWLQEQSIKDRQSQGFHHPESHSNPFIVPPPLRADGKTRCDKCDLSMSEYDRLTEKDKETFRRQSNAAIECDAAYRRYIVA